MARILIAGGGFGGLVTAEILSAALGNEHQITLVAPNRMFTFYPGLVQLAFGAASIEDVRFDLEARLNELKIHFVKGNVTGIDGYDCTVDIVGDDCNGTMNYDFLVLATGPQLAIGRVPGFFENSHHLLGVNPALRFGKAVREFTGKNIVVGLCPGAKLPVAVCETAFALARRFEMELAAEDVNIRVIFPESLESAFGGAHFSAQLEKAFSKHGINVLYDIPISDVTSSDLHSSKGHTIEHDLLMLMPPFRGHEMFRSLGAVDENDFLQVDEFMRVKNMLNVFAVGDAVAFTGPKFAHMAVRQAKVAAMNVKAELEGRQPSEAYYHEIATIINANGPDSIYLHYGIWDQEMYKLKQGRLWSWAKDFHAARWQRQHA